MPCVHAEVVDGTPGDVSARGIDDPKGSASADPVFGVTRCGNSCEVGAGVEDPGRNRKPADRRTAPGSPASVRGCDPEADPGRESAAGGSGK